MPKPHGTRPWCATTGGRETSLGASPFTCIIDGSSNPHMATVEEARVLRRRTNCPPPFRQPSPTQRSTILVCNHRSTTSRTFTKYLTLPLFVTHEVSSSTANAPWFFFVCFVRACLLFVCESLQDQKNAIYKWYTQNL